MTFDWGPDALDEQEIVSVHRAVRVFNAAAARPDGNGFRRSLTQLKLLSDARCLGFTYVSRTDGGTHYHRREVVEALARQPVRSKDDLVAMGRTGLLPGDAVLVLRQLCRQEVPEDDRRMLGPDGTVRYERGWYGYDRRADRSEDPERRREQDDASREVWPVARDNARLVEEAEASGGVVPLVVSVGGLIVSCREIVGFDREREVAGELLPRHSFRVRPAGEWAEPLLDTWLDSGAGKAALWWHFR